MNTRRSGTSVANVGQRRPQTQQPQNIATNFVPGGQMKPQQQPLIKMPTNPQLQNAGPPKVQQQQQQQQVLQQKPAVVSDVKPAANTTPARPAVAAAAAPGAVKQETLTPGKPPAVAQQTPRPQQQASARPPQMQKLTPQQQQAIKLQHALKIQQQQQQLLAAQQAKAAAVPATVAKPAVVVPPAVPKPEVVVPQQIVQQVVEKVAPLKMDGVVEGNVAPAAAMEVVEGEGVKSEEVMVVDVEAVKKKPRWLANRGNFPKISKADKLKRRNDRFRKILQPKNALMILNEMNGSTQYNFMELNNQDNSLKSMKHPGGFKAVTTVEGVEYCGTGADKATAKSNAAEAAIKSIVLRKILSASALAKQQSAASQDISADSSIANADGAATPAVASNGNVVDNDVVMSDSAKLSAAVTAAAEGLDGDMVPWMHIASFALHKLFNSWEETGTLLRASSQGNLTDIAADTSINNALFGNNTIDAAAVVNAIASPSLAQRALPESAGSMHPVMLLNQMRPGTTQYVELEVTGAPPQIMYSYECVVDGKGGFIGKGPNKKIARRNAAYAACQDVLSLTYSAEIIQDIAQSSEPRKIAPTAAMPPRFNKQRQAGGGGGGGGYYARQGPMQQQQQLQQQQQQQQMQHHAGDAMGGMHQDMGMGEGEGDGYNNAAGGDPGYEWY